MPGSPVEKLFSSPGKRTAVLCLLLALLTLGLYNPVVHGTFINLDDNLYVTTNSNVQAGLHWSTVKWAFTTCESANWHPLTWLSHTLDWQLFGKNPAGHHYVSVLFHAIDVVLLFLLLQSATGFTWRSLTVAALFAVHPANVESVAWIAERKNVLSMVFFLLAMLAYGWYARHPSLRRYFLVAFLFALGLMAKPQIITMPFVLLLWDYWPLERFGAEGDASNPRRFAPASFRWLVLEKVPLLALAAGDAIITMYAQRGADAVRTLSEYSTYARLANTIVAYARYVGHAVWPVHLSPSYSHRGDAIPAWQIAAALLLLICLSALALGSRKRYLAVGWLWFLGTLVPMIGIVQVGHQAMADRYAYIPFIGLFLMAVWTLAEFAPGWHVRFKWLALPACLAISICCLLTHTLLGYWHDSEALWRYAIRMDNQDFLAHSNLGRYLVIENKHDEAISEFIIAQRLHNYSLADVLFFAGYELRRGWIDDAKARCLDVLSRTQDPHLRSVAYTSLGVGNLRQNDLAQAKVNFEAALQAESKASGAFSGLGLIAERNGDLQSATEYFTRAVQMDPSDLGYFLLAVAYERSGHETEARAAYAQAVQLSTDIKQVVDWAHELLPVSEPSVSAGSGSEKLHVVARP